MRTIYGVFAKLILLASLVGVLVLTATSPVYADTSKIFPSLDCTGGPRLCGSKSEKPVTDVVATVIQVLIWAVAIVCVIVIIVSGLRYIMAAGDTSKIEQAKNSLLYAIVGLLAALLSFAIVYFVTDIFK